MSEEDIDDLEQKNLIQDGESTHTVRVKLSGWVDVDLYAKDAKDAEGLVRASMMGISAKRIGWKVIGLLSEVLRKSCGEPPHAVLGAHEITVDGIKAGSYEAAMQDVDSNVSVAILRMPAEKRP